MSVVAVLCPVCSVSASFLGSPLHMHQCPTDKGACAQVIPKHKGHCKEDASKHRNSALCPTDIAKKMHQRCNRCTADSNACNQYAMCYAQSTKDTGNSIFDHVRASASFLLRTAKPLSFGHW